MDECSKVQEIAPTTENGAATAGQAMPVGCAAMQQAGPTSLSTYRVVRELSEAPPPSYDHVLAENRMAAEKAEVPGGQAGAAEAAGSSGEGGGRIEVLHKSSKELYRAVAAQWGVTCKMSDRCRCLDCQSRYFDCEYDQNEQEKTDGGLSAGTPMFLSEVLHGSACAIL